MNDHWVTLETVIDDTVFTSEVQVEIWGLSLKGNFKISHISYTVFEINVDGEGRKEVKEEGRN